MPEQLLGTKPIDYYTGLSEGDKKSRPIDYKTSPSLSDFGTDVVPVGDLVGRSSKYDIDVSLQDITNLENQRGLIQPTSSKIVNGLGRLVTTAGTKALEGLGYTTTAIPALLSGDMSVLTDNAWSNAFSSLEENIKAQMPIYKTNKYSEGNILDQMGTIEFWTDDVIDGLAFMASALIGSYGFSQVGKAAKLSKLFPKAVKAAQTGKHTNITPMLKKFAEEGELLGMSLFNSMSEAGFEAKDIKEQVLSQLQSQIDDGIITQEEANQKASDAARNTFLANMVALMPSNYVSNSLIFKNFKGSKSRLQKVLTDSKYANNEIKDLSKRELLGVFGKNSLKSVLSEGVWEENIQTAVQNYETQVAVSNPTQKNRLLGYANEWVNNFTTDEGQKAIVLGAIIGLIPGGIGGVSEARAERDAIRKLKPLVNMSISQLRQGGIQDFYKRATVIDENGEEVETDAVSIIDGKPEIDYVKVAEVFKSVLHDQIDLTASIEAVSNNNELAFDFIREKKFAETILPFLEEEGGLEALDNHLEVLARQEVEDLQRSNNEVDNKSIEDLSNNYKTTARELKKIYDTIVNYQIPNIKIKGFKNLTPSIKKQLIKDQYSEAWNQLFWQNKKTELESKKADVIDQPIFRGKEAAEVEKKTPGSIENLKERLQAPFEKQIKEVEGILEESYERYKNLLDENKQKERFESEINSIQKGIEEIQKRKETIATEKEVEPEEVTTDDVINEDNNEKPDIVEPDKKVQYYDENDNLIEGTVKSYNEENDEYILDKNGKEITISAKNIVNTPETIKENPKNDNVEPLNDEEIEELTEVNFDIDTQDYGVIPYSHYERDENNKVKLDKKKRPVITIRQKQFHEYIINPNNNLKNATVEFIFDLGSNDYIKNKIWPALKTKYPKLADKILNGEKLTNNEIDYLLKIDARTTNNFVDQVPLKIVFKDGETTFSDGLWYSTTKGIKGGHNLAYRQNRAKILGALLRGEKFTLTNISKNIGKPNYSGKDGNISEKLETKSDKVKIGVVGRTRSLSTGKTSFGPKGIKSFIPGQVYISTNATPTKGEGFIRANISRLSEEHAKILFQAIKDSHTKDKGGYRQIFKHPDVEGDLTIAQVIEFLVLYGEAKTSLSYKGKGIDNSKDLPGYLLSKQLYVEKGSILHYGENTLNLHSTSDKEYNSFINWATKNKNYAINRNLNTFKVTLEDRFKQDFKIGSIKVSNGDKYSSVLIDNNILTTNVENINGSVFYDAKVTMDFSNSSSVTETKEQPKETPKPKSTPSKIVTELSKGKNKIDSATKLAGLPIGSVVYSEFTILDINTKEPETIKSTVLTVGEDGIIENLKLYPPENIIKFTGKKLSEVAKDLFNTKGFPKSTIFVDTESAPEVKEVQPEQTFENDGTTSLDDDWEDEAPWLIANPHLNKSYKKINIESELKWFKERFGDLPIEVVDTLIQTSKKGRLAFGQFKLDHITLSKLGIIGTLYHEAFHRVSLAYLTNNQREEIYNEARSRYNMSSASDLEIEERLAEEFRFYGIKNGNVRVEGNTISNFFKKLWSAIIRFFTGKNQLKPLDIDKLFKSIQSGQFRYSKVLKENLARLKGKQYDLEVRGKELKTITSREDLKELIRSLTYILIKRNGITSDVEKFGQLDWNLLWDKLAKQIVKYNSYAVNNKGKDVVPSVNQAIQWAEMYQEVLDNKELFFEYIADELATLNIKVIPENYDNEEDNGLDSGIEKFDKASYEVDSKDNILSTIKFLVGTLPDNSGRSPLTNFYKFVDFNESWNKIMDDLHDKESYEEMKSFMEIQSTKQDPLYTVLLKRLESGDEILKVQFEVSVRLHKHNFMNVLFTLSNKKPEFKFSDADVQKLSNRLIKQWNTNFAIGNLFVFEANKPTKPNAKNIKEVIKLYDDLTDKINKEWNTFSNLKNIPEYINQVVSFLNQAAIGADELSITKLTESDETGKALVDFINDRLFYFKTLLEKISTKDVAIEDISTIFKNESVVEDLAKAYAQSHGELMSTTVLGPENAPYYVYALNSILSDTVRKLRKNDPLYEELKSIVYNQNSWFLKELEDKDKQSKFNVITLGGLFEENTRDTGRQYLDFTDVEDFIVKLSLTNRGMLPLPTLADRKAYYVYSGIGKKEFNYTINEGIPTIPTDVLDVFVGYAEDEFNRIQKALSELEATKNEDGTYNYNLLVRNYHYFYNDGKYDVTKGNAYKFQHFTDFNKKPVTLTSVFDRKQAKETITKILNTRIKEQLEYAKELNIISQEREGYKNNLLPESIVKNNTTQFKSEDLGIKNLIAEYTINTMISSIETEKLMVGDPAYYKAKFVDKENTTTEVDKIKRMSVLTSTGHLLKEIVQGFGELPASTTYRSTTFDSRIFSSPIYDQLLDKHIELYKELLKDQYTNENELNKQARKIAKTRLKKFTEVDQTDAQVFISPEMFRAIAIKLGEWSETKQKAFDILNSTKPIPEGLEKEVAELVMQPLKLLYFGMDIKDGNGVPIYDKMSMATLFRRVVTGTQLEQILDRMEAKRDPKGRWDYTNQDTIHQVKFDSAVKVGNQKTKKLYKSDDTISYLNDVEIYTQQFTHLRRQLVTDPHKVKTSLFGTQAKKVGIMNIKKDGIYTLSDTEVNGQNIYDIVNASIGNLSNRGKERLLDKLGISGEDYSSLDDGKLLDMMRRDAKTSKMTDAVIESLVLEDGVPYLEFDAFPDRKWMQSRFVSMVNKHCVDLKLPGNQYIQMSNVGLRSIEIDNSLKIRTEDGYVEAMVSISLFKDIIPNYSKNTFEQNRKWLKENETIMKGLGFRIPTQGQNSMPPLKFVDVLPEQIGDTIILPAEFTALTGSDFDIDKLFVIRYNYYTKGNDIHKIEFRDIDTNNKEEVGDLYDELYGRIKNKLLAIDKYLDKEYQKGKDIDVNSHPIVVQWLTELAGEIPEYFTDKDLETLLDGKFQMTLQDYQDLKKRTEKLPDKTEWVNNSLGKNVYELNSKAAVENRLIDSYLAVLTNDTNSLLFTTTPLDANTDPLRRLASKAREVTEWKIPPALYTVSPYYQALVKAKYTGGKRGIGPFALANVHHVLAQQSGLLLNDYIGIGNNNGKKINILVDKSQSWGELKDKPVYSSEGVNTMRTSNKKNEFEHFGNPFTGSGIKGLIQKNSVKEAVEAYEEWLEGSNYKDVNIKQREWILEQIDSGKLDNVTLLYMNTPKGNYIHADALKTFITKRIIKKKIKTDLSQIYGIDNVAISDWLSALIDAHVDIAKDPYIMDLNVNPYTYDVISLLIRAGVGEMSFKYLAQPILKELAILSSRQRGTIGKQRGNNRKKLEKKYNKLLEQALKKEQLKRTDLPTIEVWNDETLSQDMSGNTTASYYARQLEYLGVFSNLKLQGKKLQELVMASQVDTKKFGNNLIETKAFINSLNSVYSSDYFTNADKLMNYDPITQSVPTIEGSSFLTQYLENSVLLIPKLFREKTLYGSIGFMDVHEALLEYTDSTIYNPLIHGTRDDYKALLNELSDELFTGIASKFFTNENGLGLTNKEVHQLFLGNNSLVTKIHKIKADKKYQHLWNNKLFKLFNTEFSDDIINKPSFITIPSSKPKDKWTKDDLTSAWEELFNSEDPYIQKVARGLFIYSFFSSGFRQNIYSFFNFIPPKVIKLMERADGELVSFNEFIKEVRQVFNNGSYTELVNDIIDDVFINNHHNDALVPRVSVQDIPSETRKYFGNEDEGYYIGFAAVTDMDLFIGKNKNNEPMYKPFIKYDYKDKTYLMKYFGYDSYDDFPIYYTIEKKGYYDKGKRIKEYGLERSIIPENRLKRTYTPEEVLERASKKYIGPVIQSDYKQSRLYKRITEVQEENAPERNVLDVTTEDLENGKNREKEC